jgi:hypothetical protein
MSLAERLSPSTALIPGPDGCLVNGESFGGTYPLYHATQVPQGRYSCAASASTPTGGPVFTLTESDMGTTPGWFWHPNDPVLNASTILEQINIKLGQGESIIFNVPPNASGVMPEEYIATLAAVGAARTQTYSNPSATLQSPVSAACSDLSFVVDVAAGASFDQIMIQEDLSANGQVIASYTVEAFFPSNSSWTRLPVHGLTVGSTLLDIFPAPITGASQLRFNCTADLGPPPLAHIVNAGGSCLGIPQGESFPCWTGGVGPFSLCPLVVSPCSDSTAAVVFEVPPGQGGLIAESVAGNPVINVDCDTCTQGTHAKLLIGDNYASGLAFVGANGGQIQVVSCPGMCLTNGTAGGAKPSCAGSEPWTDSMVHLDLCTSESTFGWSKVLVPSRRGSAVPGSEGKTTEAAASLVATISSFGAYTTVPVAAVERHAAADGR